MSLSNDKKSKLNNFKQLFTDLNDDECQRILESNAWNPDLSADSVLRNRATKANGTEDPVPLLRNKRKFSEMVKQEVNIAMSREVICYSPVLSREAHPWLYKLVYWASVPVTVAVGFFNLFLRQIFFWRSSKMDRSKLELQEVQLMEQLSSCYLMPVVKQPARGAAADSGVSNASVTLFLGTFEEAISQARCEHKFLMVYLHRLGHTDSDNFLNTSLLHEDVVKILNDPENILIWVGYLCPDNLVPPNSTNQNVATQSEDAEREGWQISQLLNMNFKPTSCPIFSNTIPSFLFKQPDSPFLLALLVNSPNYNLGRKQQMNVIGQLERPLETRELINLLKKWIEIGNRPRLLIKKERASRDAVQNLRREQEAAFSEMLARDRKNENVRQAELDRMNALCIKKEELRNKLTQMMEHTLTLASPPPLASSPYFHNHKSEATESSCCHVVTVMIRMHNARRFPWTFPINYSVKYLYYVVYSQFDAPIHFELLWGYPQRLLGYRPSNLDNNEIQLEIDDELDAPSFSDLGMKENQVILVRDQEA